MNKYTGSKKYDHFCRAMGVCYGSMSRRELCWLLKLTKTSPNKELFIKVS